MKIYILAVGFKKDDDVHSVLNGRLFRIKKDNNDNSLAFFDAIQGHILLTSTPLISDETDDHGVRWLKTESGTIYGIRRIEDILPTKGPSYCGSAYDWADPSKIVELTHEIVHRDSKEINYGDGYRLVQYRFNLGIDYETFKKFAESQKLLMREKKDADWYEDYSEIRQIDEFTWEHKTILRYTD